MHEMQNKIAIEMWFHNISKNEEYKSLVGRNIIKYQQQLVRININHI